MNRLTQHNEASSHRTACLNTAQRLQTLEYAVTLGLISDQDAELLRLRAITANLKNTLDQQPRADEDKTADDAAIL